MYQFESQESILEKYPKYSQPSETNPMKTIIHPNLEVTSTAPRPMLTRNFIPYTPIFQYQLSERELGAENSDDSSSRSYQKMVPLTCPSNMNMFITRRSEPQADLMTVLLIGNLEVPEVRAFAPTTTSIEFVGHLSYTSPIFRIIYQLPLVSKVALHIGPNQLPIFRETPEDIYNGDEETGLNNEKTPVCEGVEELEIIMDLDAYYVPSRNCSNSCYYKCWDLIKSTFDLVVETFLLQARASFPNLKRISAHLPESDLCNGLLQALVEAVEPSSRHRPGLTDPDFILEVALRAAEMTGKGHQKWPTNLGATNLLIPNVSHENALSSTEVHHNENIQHKQLPEISLNDNSNSELENTYNSNDNSKTVPDPRNTTSSKVSASC